jgi:hypothetical protein
MRFAKIVFYIAAVWGFLVLTPLYFIFDLIGRKDPPAITHPGFYYGFAGVALVWQVAFFFIARDPVRLRPMMIVAALEKFIYIGSMAVLFLQSRVPGSDVILGIVDLSFGILFLVSYFKTADTQPLAESNSRATSAAGHY